MGRTSAKGSFPRSRVEIFRNEHTRSTPLHPKLMFWRVSNNLGAFWKFGLLTKLGAKRTELVQKSVPRSRVGISSNDCTRSTPLDPKLMFLRIWYYLDAFGTDWLSCDTRCKTRRTSAEVDVIKSRSNFPQERTRSTPLDPKLMFWPVLYYFGAFRTVWCETSRISAKVCNTKSCQNVSQRTDPIHPIRP